MPGRNHGEGTLADICRSYKVHRSMIKRIKRLHKNHPTLLNPKWTKEVFDSACQPKAWMHVARQLRSSADAIFERETPIATRYWDELRQLAADVDYDESKFQQPNFNAAHMLMAFAIENLLKGLAVAKGLVQFSEQKLPKSLEGHDLYKLHQLATPNAIIESHELDVLTYMSVWRARYPFPTSVDEFWPMRSDGTIKAVCYRWPDFNTNIVSYYDDLEAELRELV